MVEYKTSVIIPVYNTEKYLDECIQSILRQTQKEIEIILVDDGSTDHSYEIMCRYAEQYANVRIFQQENKKLGAARNLGMKYANGKYYFFLDSDDYIKENCLEELYDHAEAMELDFITYDSDIFVEGIITGKRFPTYDRSRIGISEDKIYQGMDYLNTYFLIGGAYVSACLSYYNADFLRKCHICFEEQVYYEDNEFALKVYCNAKRMMYLPQKLYVRRYRENSIMTSNCGIIHLQSALKISEKCLDLLIGLNNFEERMEGVRGVIAILANRLMDQMIHYQKESDLYHNQYIKDLCYFFVSCDEKRLFAQMGLELAFAYYYILWLIVESGYLSEMPDLQEKVSQRALILRGKIIETIDELMKKLEMIEGSEKKIIIYGTGDIGQRIMTFYNFFLEESVRSDDRIVFANTNAGSGELYLKKYPIVPIREIENFSISMILVASTRYECEMCELLNQLYGAKYKYITYRELANYSLVQERLCLTKKETWRLT